MASSFCWEEVILHLFIVQRRHLKAILKALYWRCRIRNDIVFGIATDTFSQLPISGLSERVLGERAEDFEQMLEAQRPTDSFWNTRFGGSEARNVTDNIPFPVLFTTGFHDFYVGGMFAMWNSMSEQTRLPFEKGVITYYRLFENIWKCDFYKNKTDLLEIPLGEGQVSFDYNPKEPPAFCEEGAFQRNHFASAHVISLYTSSLDTDVFIKGKMKAILRVSSTCPDTSFYISVSIKKPQGDCRLRHDITSISYQLGNYIENETVSLQFSFDEHAFLLEKGECLRVDICSTDDNSGLSNRY